MLLKTQYQGSSRALRPLVGQQGVWGGMGPGGPCCMEEGVAEVYPHPQTSSSTGVWLQSCHKYMKQGLGRQHHDIHGQQH